MTAKCGHAVRVVGRPVQRVDDEAQPALRTLRPRLLREDRRAREAAAQEAEERLLRGGVGVGDEIDPSLERDGPGLPPLPAEHLPAPARRLCAALHQLSRLRHPSRPFRLVGRVKIAAWPPLAGIPHVAEVGAYTPAP